MTPESLLAGLLFLLFGGIAGWFLWGRPLHGIRQELPQRLSELREAQTSARHYQERMEENRLVAERESTRAAELGSQIASLEAVQSERERAHQRQLAELHGEFQRMAGEALEKAQRQFTEQAAETLKLHRSESERNLEAGKTALGDLIRPMRETLGRYESELKVLEAKREQAYGGLAEQLATVAQGQEAVRAEANRIVTALRSSARASGAWGEAQLRNVLEMAGLREDIDFTLQTSVDSVDGGRRRPDAVIRLPGGRELIVDSKCSLEDYIAASGSASEAERLQSLKRHSLAVRQHAKGLSEKAYWREFAASADFVVMFLPGENFLAAALEHDLGLLQWTLDQRILLAGPTNLLAIARVVAMVWRQEKMAEEAQRIGELGADLYASLATMAEHVNRVGKNIGDAASAYNDFVGSLEARVLSKARRFPELGVSRGKKELPDTAPVEKTLRLVQAAELRTAEGGE